MKKKKNYQEAASGIFKEIVGGESVTNSFADACSVQPRISNNVQLHKCAAGFEPDARLHVFIRRELEDRLLDEVARRKKDRTFPKNLANKRAVVESALEKFL